MRHWDSFDGLSILLAGVVFLAFGYGLLRLNNISGVFLLLIGVGIIILYSLKFVYEPIAEQKNRKQEEEAESKRIEQEKKEHDEEIRKKYGDLFFSVVDAINSFQPILSKEYSYNNELNYHIDLARVLQPKFPMLQVEFQLGSARPDIVIEDIAIEIKGPTYEEGLRSLADKCGRYPLHFKKLIIVLFNLQT